MGTCCICNSKTVTNEDQNDLITLPAVTMVTETERTSPKAVPDSANPSVRGF